MSQRPEPGARVESGTVSRVSIGGVEVAVLGRLFSLVRLLSTQQDAPPKLLEVAEELRGLLADAGPPFELGFFADGVYRDGQYVPMTAEAHRRLEALVHQLTERGVQRFAVRQVPAAEELVALARGLASRSSGQLQIPAGIELGPLPPERFGPLPRPDYGEPLATAQLERALVEASDLCDRATREWPFDLARMLSSRIDWAAEVSAPAASRFIELGVGPWSRPRRAVAAGLHVALCLCWLDVEAAVRRAAIHATLALAAYGLGDRGGREGVEAAASALERLGQVPADEEVGVDGHRLRVTALLRGLAHPKQPNAENRVSPMCLLGYDLERVRCPTDLELELTKLDLLAWAVSELGYGVHPWWGKALVCACGPAPVGAHVLAEGRLGVVVAPNDARPWQPVTAVGGQLVKPKQPVLLQSPLAGE